MQRWSCLLILIAVLAGCGTTRHTDSARTATEQLLVSGAVDQALEGVRLDALRGAKVYFDEKYADSAKDMKYVLFSVREKLLQEGALLQGSEEEADVIVQVAIGALGTDRYELLVGVPEVTGLGVVSTQFPIPPALPEIPIIKATNQHGVAKLRIVAYDRHNGNLVAMTGKQAMSTIKNQSTWFAGIGPFERGGVRRSTQVAGTPISLPSIPGITLQSNGAAEIGGAAASEPTAAAQGAGASSPLASEPFPRRQ